MDMSLNCCFFFRRAVISKQEVDPTERAYDNTASAYSIHLATKGLPPSSKGTRDELPIRLEVSFIQIH